MAASSANNQNQDPNQPQGNSNTANSQQGFNNALSNGTAGSQSMQTQPGSLVSSMMSPSNGVMAAQPTTTVDYAAPQTATPSQSVDYSGDFGGLYQVTNSDPATPATTTPSGSQPTMLTPTMSLAYDSDPGAPPASDSQPSWITPTMSIDYGDTGGMGAPGTPTAGASSGASPAMLTPSWSDGNGMTDTGLAGGAPPSTSPTTTPTVPDTSQVPTDSSGNVITPTDQTASPIPALPTVTDPSQNADNQALIAQLQQRANQGLVVDPNDPTIKAQTDAYAAQQQRAAINYDADQAEKNSPYSTGANQTTQRMMAETAGQNTAGFQGQLMQNELTARRNDIQNALSELGSTLTQDQQQALQAQLGNLNAAIAHQGMTVQNQQFYSSLNQNDKQFVDQLTQNERFKNMDDALSRYTLAQQQTQFAASLAQQADFKNLDVQMQKDQLSQQDQEFLKQLAQTGDYQKFQETYLTDKMKSDSNNYLAGLAQNGQIAQMQDIFNKMQLAQQGVEFGAGLGQNEAQFLDQLGFNTSQSQNFFDNIQRTGS